MFQGMENYDDDCNSVLTVGVFFKGLIFSIIIFFITTAIFSNFSDPHDLDGMDKLLIFLKNAAFFLLLAILFPLISITHSLWLFFVALLYFPASYFLLKVSPRRFRVAAMTAIFLGWYFCGLYCLVEVTGGA